MTRLYAQYQSRIGLVTLSISGLLLVIAMRMFNVMVFNHDRYTALATRQGRTEKQLVPMRGNILDRNGEKLTANVYHYSFAADPQVLQHGDSLVTLLADTFGRSRKYYRSMLQSERAFVWLERDIPRTEAQPLLTFNDRGFITRQTVRRHYPYTQLTGPIIGRTNVDNQGLSGIEMEYDTFLRGEKETQVLRRDAKGRVLPQPGSQWPEMGLGHDIQLTIDIDYQSILHDELARGRADLSARAAQGIIMDPQTGQILAMAQHSGYVSGHRKMDAIRTRRLMPVTDLYEPGSIFKVIPVMAALEEKILSPDDLINCENGEFAYHTRLISDTYPKGIVPFSEALAFSSNIGIIKMAEIMGPEILYRFLIRSGIGARTGIALPGESPGILRKLPEWSALSLGEIAMGQEVGVTTLQMAMVYSAIANGGLLLRPQIVRSVTDAQGNSVIKNKPEVMRRVASTKTMSQILAMLEEAVESGTGATARIPGYRVAGKTGTAQKFVEGKYSEQDYIPSFAAIFPADKPQLVCVITVDSPVYGRHFGSMAAAPIARHVLMRIMNLDPARYRSSPKRQPNSVQIATKMNKQDRIPYMLATAAVIPRVPKGHMPNLKGMSLRKSLQVARKAGVSLDISGSGQVIEQSIPPGTRIDEQTICSITLRAAER